MQVFLLINTNRQGTIVGAFASKEAARRYARRVDPRRTFTYDITEVPWFDNYENYYVPLSSGCRLRRYDAVMSARRRSRYCPKLYEHLAFTAAESARSRSDCCSSTTR